MNQKHYLAAVVASMMVMLFLLSASASADSIKARMKARLPTIIQLKAAGIIGETHLGFLAFIGSNKVDQDLVTAENADRRTVYQAIAKQQGTTATVVGQRRALQIANKAQPGEWFQDADGTWYRK